jgi:hypothetical protein
MNNYALDAEGSRWWWTPTGLGAAVAAAVAAILIVPAVAYDAPVEPVKGSTLVEPPVTERPCFMWRAPRGSGWDGFPTCPKPLHETSAPTPQPPGATRPGLDSGP